MANWQEKYEKAEEIGEGSSGKIYKLRCRQTGETLAAKIISVESQGCDLQAIEQEVKIMGSCSHPNVIRCLAVEIYAAEVWIILEYCEGHSLADIIKSRRAPFAEEEVAAIMRQALEGLAYLHQHSIVHRDIKASNLLYQKGVVKIADFGISIVNQNSISESKFGRFGSPYWMSPEILSHSIYNEKTDIWALGITAIELAEGQPPYSHQHPFRAIYSIQTHPPQGLSKPQRWSEAFNSFVKNCLSTNYQSRPNANTLANHDFIAGNGKAVRGQKSPESRLNQSEDTIIMHEDIPKSIWEKSYPQSTQKDRELNYSRADTVIIKQYPSQQDLSLRIQQQIASHQGDQRKESRQRSVKQREKKVQALMLEMEEQVKEVRKRYMKKIREMYKGGEGNKQNKSWNSPVKRLKDRHKGLQSKQNQKEISCPKQYNDKLS